MRVLLRLHVIDGLMPSIEYAFFKHAIFWPESLRLPIVDDAIVIDDGQHTVSGVALMPQRISIRDGDENDVGAVISIDKKIWGKESKVLEDFVTGFNLQNWTLTRPLVTDDNTDIIPAQS